MRTEIIEKTKYLTSEDPKIARIIQKASDFCLKKYADVYRGLEEYDKNYGNDKINRN